MKHAEAIDDLLWNALQALLAPADLTPTPNCSHDRINLARVIATLPLRLDGGGLTAFSSTAPAAWWASLTYSIWLDDQLRDIAGALTPHIQAAHSMLKQRLLHAPTLEVKGVLSDDPTAVLRPEEFYSVKLAAAN